MEREIKFRAWDKAGKKFTDQIFINAIGEVYYDCDPHGINMSGRRQIAMANDRFELVWFVGYTDSEGTEVFTGDIVQWDYEYDSDYDGDMPIVKRSAGRKKIENTADTWIITTAKSEGGKIHVIGNIFRNPELL